MSPHRLLPAVFAACLAATPALAEAPRTPQGRISVGQVMDALQRAPKDAAARGMLTAYLTGLAEASATLNEAARTRLGKPLFCGAPGSMDGKALATLLRGAAPDTRSWSKVEATPIILGHLLKQKGC